MQLVLPFIAGFRRFAGQGIRSGTSRVHRQRELAGRQTLRSVERSESTIRCLSGSVWVTSDKGGGDRILSAGGQWKAGRGEVIVIEALGDAKVEILV